MKAVLEQAQMLLKVAKENPEQFRELGKALTDKEKKSLRSVKGKGSLKCPGCGKQNKGAVNGDWCGHCGNEILGKTGNKETEEVGMATAEKPMSKEEILKEAKALLKVAKEDPAKFEEITKAMAAPAPAPMAKPTAPKAPAAMPAAKMPAAQKPASMRMSKEEIKADLAKPWEPKHKKTMAGC